MLNCIGDAASNAWKAYKGYELIKKVIIAVNCVNIALNVANMITAIIAGDIGSIFYSLGSVLFSVTVIVAQTVIYGKAVTYALTFFMDVI